ncbi:MAG: sugar transferase [bacterium]
MHSRNGRKKTAQGDRINEQIFPAMRPSGIRCLRRSTAMLIHHPVYTLEAFFEQSTPGWKRCLDILLASFAIVAFSPLLLSITLFILVVSPGPIFFKQTRIGKMRKPFTIWKFRTMKIDSGTDVHKEHFENIIDTDDEMHKLDAQKDPRVILFGNILRQSGLDELPQLINVIKGEMSIVGPRPCLPYEAEKYVRWQNSRFDVLPGITGLWQVSGKNKTTFKEMMRLDITYSRKLSFREDVRIIFRTLSAVIAQVRGA